jgi:hypothetical protein
MKVRIFKPHTHGDTTYTPENDDGMVIDLPEDAAAYVIEHAGAKAEGEASKASKQPADNDA